MASLITIFREEPDPRRGDARRHDLLEILTIALVASVCGVGAAWTSPEFAEDREPLLREFLRLENGLPSHETFSRVFRLLDLQAFGRAFEAFLTDLGADGAGLLAIDGKTLRRSFDRAAGRSALHVVTAFGTHARLSVGPAGRRAGGERDHRGAGAARDADPRRRPRHRRRHPRDRSTPGAPAMPGLAMLACVEAIRDDGPASTRYDLSSARLSPQAFAGAVRSHGAIENSLHGALDVTFDEDAARNHADSGPEMPAPHLRDDGSLRDMCEPPLRLRGGRFVGFRPEAPVAVGVAGVRSRAPVTTPARLTRGIRPLLATRAGPEGTRLRTRPQKSGGGPQESGDVPHESVAAPQEPGAVTDKPRIQK